MSIFAQDVGKKNKQLPAPDHADLAAQADTG
jgi:hypothetical protein